jgi:hypothetical protein
MQSVIKSVFEGKKVHALVAAARRSTEIFITVLGVYGAGSADIWLPASMCVWSWKTAFDEDASVRVETRASFASTYKGTARIRRPSWWYAGEGSLLQPCRTRLTGNTADGCCRCLEASSTVKASRYDGCMCLGGAWSMREPVTFWFLAGVNGVHQHLQ